MSNIKGTIVYVKDFLWNNFVEITIKNGDSEQIIFKLDSDRSYCIPDFQREIRWSKDNLYELMSDIRSGARFLGNIILTKHGDNRFDIIDGQQRVTLLFMLVHYIKYKYQDELSIGADFCKLINESFDKYQDFMELNYSLKDLTPTQREEFEKSDKLGQIDSFMELWNSISENDILSDSTKAGEFLKNLERCEVNVILSEQDSTNYSIEYFIDVNLKGVRLDDEDIFKGYLFYLDSSKDIRDSWVELKQNVKKFNTACANKSKAKSACYPLMKILEHFFYCDLYSIEKYKNIEFAEDFRIKEKVQLGTTWHYTGEHLLKTINNVGYMQRSLKSINKLLNFLNNIVLNESPNDDFKKYFVSDTGEKILDEDDIKIFYKFFKYVCLDRTMIVSKAILMKYLLSVILNEENKNKNDYKKFYMIFMFSTLFALFESKKGIEPISKILKASDWPSEMSKVLSNYLNPSTIKTLKRSAEFKFSTNPENEEQRYHSIMLAAIYNYFSFDGKTVKVKKGKTKQLAIFLNDANQFSVEHFIVNNGKVCTTQITSADGIYTYEYTDETKKYAASIFNYIFIPETTNKDLGYTVVQEKVEKLDVSKISCEYSKMIIEKVKDSFSPILLTETEEDKQKKHMHQYFSYEFKEQYSKLVGMVLEEIASRFIA